MGALLVVLAGCDRKPTGGSADAVASATASAPVAAATSAVAPGPPPSAFPASVGYRRYVNARFAFGVDVPTFLHEEEPPTNGDGQSFTFGDALTLRAWGMFAMQPLAAAFREDAARPEVSYKAKQKDGYVVSGVTSPKDGSRVFYKRVLFAGDVMKVVELEYAPPLKAAMDPIVARVAGSLETTGGVSP